LVSISTERLTRIEFPETLRSVFLGRSNVAVEKEDTSLFVRALAPEIEDTLFVVGEGGTTSCLKRAAMTFWINDSRYNMTGPNIFSSKRGNILDKECFRR